MQVKPVNVHAQLSMKEAALADSFGVQRASARKGASLQMQAMFVIDEAAKASLSRCGWRAMRGGGAWAAPREVHRKPSHPMPPRSTSGHGGAAQPWGGGR